MVIMQLQGRAAATTARQQHHTSAATHLCSALHILNLCLPPVQPRLPLCQQLLPLCNLPHRLRLELGLPGL